jgi:hypothetical protein
MFRNARNAAQGASMSRILYSHRVHGVLKQLVVELGLEVSLKDAKGEDILTVNDGVFEDAAAVLSVDLSKSQDDGGAVYTFRPK